MIETGVIEKINGKYATIAFERTEACEKCRMCNLHKNKTFVSIVVENTLNAQTGDKVSVEMSNRIVLKAAAIVYLIPLILVVIALLATMKLKELYQIIAVTAAILTGFIIDILFDRINKKKKNYIAKMLEIVKENKDE